MRSLWLVAALLLAACLPSAGAERVLQDWHFDGPAALADWDLNGDILFWDDLLGCAFELSSMSS